MIHALLVDDEENIRKGIASILKNSDLEMGKIYECENAEEALQVLQENEIHVIIADIRMPGINGLAFVREAAAQNKKMPPVIFLSGYAEFEYAAEAVRLQAFDYLLKPVDIQELVETVRQASNREMIMAEGLLYEVLSAKIQSVWMSQTEQAASEGYDFQQHAIFENEFCLMIVKCASIKNEMRFIENNQHKFSYSTPWIAMRFKSKLLVIFHPQNRQAILHQIGEENIINLSQTSVGTNVNHLKSLLQEVLEVDKYHSIQDIKQIKFSAIQERIQGEISSKDFSVLEDFRNQDEKKLKKAIENLLCEEAKKTYFFDYFEKLEQEIYVKIISKYKMVCHEADVFEKDCILKYGIEVYQKKLIDFFEAVSETLSSYQNGKNDYENKMKTIEKSILFIDENFNKNINMASVANYVGLNYYYFSNMFKKMVGQSFVDYLKMVRTNRAKQLLGDSDLKISDISKKCGYEDAKQFSKIFKKLTGMSPKEYQRFYGQQTMD
ncbi:response regulator transcription factor [Scatolibacter rhodanostii]|uniref:response regulator transcription factor n=1 Tax=Scatolibacter rhodanostii TaxID=2014781 RepID=UPI000C07370A|nr:response regulator [Scatolibacter rhodanostii]